MYMDSNGRKVIVCDNGTGVSTQYRKSSVYAIYIYCIKQTNINYFMK